MTFHVCVAFLVLVWSVQFLIATEWSREALDAKIEEERRAISEHRIKLDNAVSDMQRKIESRILELNEQVQKTTEQARQIQEDSLKSSSPGSNTFISRVGGNFGNQEFKKDFSSEKSTPLNLEKLREGSTKRRQNGDLQSILSRHSVDEKMVEDISQMARSAIPHESMVQYVKQHFPDKRPDDCNDIVIAALGSRHLLVNRMDNEKSLQIETENRQRNFDRTRASFDIRHPSDDL